MSAWIISVVLALAFADPALGAGQVSAQKPAHTHTSTLANLGFTNGLLMSSRNAHVSFAFPIPHGIPMLGGAVELDYTVLPLGLLPATMEVAINGTPRTAVSLTTSPRHRLRLSLTPADLAKPALAVTVRAASLHQDREVCSDTVQIFRDLHILPTSGLTLTLPRTVPPSIRAFWELLPRAVTLSTMPADPAKPMPHDAFIAAWALSTVLLREGRTVDFAQLPTPGHVLIASAEDMARIKPAPTPIADDEGNRQVSLWASPSFSGLVFLPPHILSTIAPLAQPMIRPLLTAWHLDAPTGAVQPLKSLPLGRSVPLSTLGLTDAWRSMSTTAQWEFSVGPSQIPPPFQPKALHVQLVATPARSNQPTLFSLHINDILVQVVRLKDTGDPQSVTLALPERYLRRANTFKLTAQRDSDRKICEARDAQAPIQVLPSSTLEVASQIQAPTTFAALSTHLGQEVSVYLPRSALTRPSRLLAFLSRLTADFHVFPDEQNLVFYEPGDSFHPTGPFVLLGHPADPPTAPVSFTRGRIQMVDPDNNPILDVALDVGQAVAQIAHSHGYPGLWIHAANLQELPLPPSLWLEHGDVAIVSNLGQIFTMASAFTEPVAISYPDDAWWVTDPLNRYWLFFLAWLVFTGAMVYLFRVTRRQEAAASAPTKQSEQA